MNREDRLTVLMGLLLLLLTGCSTTKMVPDDDQLFIGLTAIDYQSDYHDEHFAATQEEVEAALATAPNGALFGSSYYRTPFPYGLWVWNWAHGSSGRFKQWMNRTFGKAPVLMSQVNPALRASVAQSVLRKNGYMHGRVTYQEVPQRNPKKMKIGYSVVMDSLFTVDTLEYVKFPRQMQALIDSTRSVARLKSGMPFSVSTLDGERSRISQLFRNSGYYYYQPGMATYLADTFDVANHARVRLQLADSLPPEVLHPWYIGKTTVRLRRSFRDQPTDSTERRSLKILFSGKRPPIRPGVILRQMKLRSRSAFSYDNYQESMQKVNATGVFSSVDFQFTPRDRDTLDLMLNCTFDQPYDVYIESNLVNRTIGRMGPELKVGVTRRNAFRGGEKLDINVHGNYEWQTSSSINDDMNSFQYGADASIEFPRIIAPFYRERRRRRPSTGPRQPLKPRYFSTPWTIAKVSTDIVRRPSYYKMHIASGEWTYRWQPSETSKHEFSPLTLKYQFMNSHTDEFERITALNPYILVAMDDYFIPKMRYTYTYASTTDNPHPFRWETTFEEAGNATALYDHLVQGNKWTTRGKTLFKNEYAQFLRVETDITKRWPLDSKTQLVAHLNAGAIWSYGNSTESPFSESFYVGGANSIRAFTMRAIGPGGFSGLDFMGKFNYLMRDGDFKLVMNLEYRRKLFGNLEGAVFLDAGNVWALQDRTVAIEDEDSPEMVAFVNQWNEAYSTSRLRASTFLDQLATGTGIGLRYDLEFLVVRLDWGFALHSPYDNSRSGYFNISRFRDMHAFHFAIGYPF